MSLHPLCEAWDTRSDRVLGGGPATLSKHRSRYPKGLAPSVFIRGEGAVVTCPDLHTYVDMVAALGPVLLGHNNPAVSLAVMEQADQLACSSLSTPMETEVAEMLCASIPGAEQVRFGMNGKDVTEAAIRLARHVTGHDHVIYVGYAGGFSDYLSTTDKNGGILAGVGEYNHQVPWRDFAALEAVFDQMHVNLEPGNLAAIILEVPPEYAGVSIEETARVITRYKEAAHSYGALCILDEIVTGLRYGLGGAQATYGVQVDLVTMSKALGNGYPIAALMGERDCMQEFTGGKVFFSTTFGGSPIGLAAAKATLTELQSSTWGWTRLETWGLALYAMLEQAFSAQETPVKLKGNFARMVLEWQDVPGVATSAELYTLWLQETVKRGVFFGVPIFPMCAYTPEVMTTITEAVQGSLAVIETAIHTEKVHEALEVPVIQSVFERYETAKTIL